MIKHTPGPWAFKRIEHPNGTESFAVYEAAHSKHWESWQIAGLGFTTQDEANARLIAAAPMLLQELINIATAKPHEWEDDVRDQFQEWAQSRARWAIQQVTGESV